MTEPTIVDAIERARQAQQRHRQLHPVQLELKEPEPTWTEFYCGKCHHEAAFYGEPPTDYEFVCNCEDDAA
jgi:hypothetical protein